MVTEEFRLKHPDDWFDRCFPTIYLSTSHIFWVGSLTCECGKYSSLDEAKKAKELSHG